MTSSQFAIIEVEDGLTIIELEPSGDAEVSARAYHGIVVDAGPFPTYEAAYDELLNLEANEDDELVD